MEAKKNPLSMQIDPALFEAATEDEKRQADVMSESTTFFKDGMRKLMKNPLAVGSIIVLVLIIITITFAPLVVPYSYSEIIKVNGRRDRSNKNLAAFEYSEMEQKYMEEGGKVFPHILGTDSLGRDYFIRVVYGARISLTVGLFASILVLIIGVIYGSIAGYTGGRTDLIMMRIVADPGKYQQPDRKRARHQYDLYFHRIRTAVLGRHGQTCQRPDPYDQE